MEVDNSKLILYFIGNKKTSIFKGYKIFKKIYDFETSEIIIPDNIFEPLKEKKIIEFQLLLNENSGEPFNYLPPFQFYVYFGENKAYCFINQISQMTYDICCLDEQIKVNYGDLNLNEFNYLKNDARSRIILINAPSIVSINNSYKINSFIPMSMSNSTSVQIAFFDSTSKAYSIKAISKDEISVEFEIINVLKEKKDILTKFFEDFEVLMNEKQEDSEIYKNLSSSIDLERIKIHFPKRKDALKKAFDDEELYDLYYKYIL